MVSKNTTRVKDSDHKPLLWEPARALTRMRKRRERLDDFNVTAKSFQSYSDVMKQARVFFLVSNIEFVRVSMRLCRPKFFSGTEEQVPSVKVSATPANSDV